MRIHPFLILAAAALPCLWMGCSKFGLGGDAAGHAEGSASEHGSDPHAEGSGSHGAAPGESASGEHSVEHARRFPVPFANEASSAEPLARTRGFVRDLVQENAAFVKTHPPAFFKPFVDSQHPRATVVTCSDSRVQSPAFDSTPENDLFFIRNIGNQIANSQGSVEYGVHHLKTAVLLILGHTGCGAVKAAMGDFSHESASIRRELDPISLPKPVGKPEDPKAWLAAVVANVNNQVASALTLFPEEMGGGDLTVVGAVYDFRNDMKQGNGKLVVVNVNGQTETERIAAFTRAVSGAALLATAAAGTTAAPHHGAH